jgi:hypothetical protein
MQRERNEAMAVAWHMARLVRIEKMPKLSSLMKEPEKKKTAPSWEQQFAQMSAFVERRKLGKR